METAQATVSANGKKKRNKSLPIDQFVMLWEDKEFVKDTDGNIVMENDTPKTVVMNKIKTLNDFCKATGMSPETATSRASQIRNQKNIPLRSLRSTSTTSPTRQVEFLRSVTGNTSAS